MIYLHSLIDTDIMLGYFRYAYKDAGFVALG